jgi:putative membrane protein
MEHILNEHIRTELDRRVAEAEKRTGAQIVLAVVKRCDTYAELPWKAFALGSAVAGAGMVLLNLARPAWNSETSVLLSIVTTLAAGGACALLCILAPAFARLFLDAHRADVEVRQYADSLFLSREVFATRSRTGVLLLVGIFERRVVLLPDTGLARRLNREAMNDIVACVTAALAAGQVDRALEQGIKGLEESIASGASGENELPNAIIEEKGV